jgi:hypothetical protein
VKRIRAIVRVTKPERLIEQSFLLLDQFKPRRYPRVLVMPEFPVSRASG